MSYFPFFTDISDKTFLIIGGGNVAADKILRIKRFTDRIIVVAPETEIEGVRVIRKEYDSEDLALGDYVVAAVGEREIDRQIARDCRAEGIPVNVVDDIEYCDFIFPSIVKRGKLTVAISTSGSSPLYARMLRQQLEEMLPENIEQVLDEMQELRERTAEEVADQKERARIYREALLEKLGV